MELNTTDVNFNPKKIITGIIDSLYEKDGIMDSVTSYMPKVFRNLYDSLGEEDQEDFNKRVWNELGLDPIELYDEIKSELIDKYTDDIETLESHIEDLEYEKKYVLGSTLAEEETVNRFQEMLQEYRDGRRNLNDILKD